MNIDFLGVVVIISFIVAIVALKFGIVAVLSGYFVQHVNERSPESKPRSGEGPPSRAYVELPWLRLTWWRILLAIICLAGIPVVVVLLSGGTNRSEEYRFLWLMFMSPFLLGVFLISAFSALTASKWGWAVCGIVLPQLAAWSALYWLYYVFDR